MNNQHTPIQWAPVDLEIKGNYARVVEIVSGKTVATITDDPTNLQPTEEAKANARLIAAVPDLLAACKVIQKDMIEQEQTHDYDGEICENYRILQEAIAKATGN